MSHLIKSTWETAPNCNNTLQNKREFIAVDFFRIIAAALVVAIHVFPFNGPSQPETFYLNAVVCRVAVPYFFVTSGFFYQRIVFDREKTRKYLKHILRLYCIYSALYLPIVLNDYTRNLHLTGKALIIKVVQNFTLSGFPILWFYMSLMVGVALLYIIENKLRWKDSTTAAVCIVLYVVGVLFNGYRSVMQGIAGICDVSTLYEKIFITTRNGLFFGLPMLFAGYWIKKHSYQIKDKKYVFAFLISLALLFAEKALSAKYVTGPKYDMSFLMAPVGIFAFLTVCFIKMPERYSSVSVTVRKISSLIFPLHLIVFKHLKLFSRKMDIPVRARYMFILVLLVTGIISYLIVVLSKKKGFKWLKALY